MIECPSCGEKRTVEIRRYQLPSGKLTPLWRWAVVAWFMLSIIILPLCLYFFTIFVGLLSVGSSLIENIWKTGTDVLLKLFLGVTFFPPIGFLIIITIQVFLPKLYKRYLFSILYRTGSISNSPIEYQRICSACNFRWAWKPGEGNRPGKSILPSSSDKAQSREPPSEKRRKMLRVAMQRQQMEAYLPYLKELKAHWQKTFVPSAEACAVTDSSAESGFQQYQQALGEPIEIHAGHSTTGYVRRYYPSDIEIRLFVRAMEDLKNGHDSRASKQLESLLSTAPKFVEPWIWITAVVDDPTRVIEYLEKAVSLEPAHPLAWGALSLARREFNLDQGVPHSPQTIELTIVRCPKCGGGLENTPSNTGATCPYCGYYSPCGKFDSSAVDAPLVQTLRLQRKFQSHDWVIGDLISCQACGSTLVHKQRLAQRCAFCGSTNVLLLDQQQAFIRPDGLLPFRYNQQSVVQMMRQAFDETKHRVERMEGVYIPHWVFDGELDRQFLFVRTHQLFSTHYDRMYTFDNLPFSAVDFPPPSMMDQLPPFDLGQMAPYDEQLLADWSAQLYSNDVEFVVEDAYDTMLALAVQKTGPPVIEGIDPPPNTRGMISLNVTQTAYQLVLMPVWVVTVNLSGEPRLILVNGQSGEIVRHTWSSMKN